MQPEPWLRGILPGLDPVIEHLLRASQQIREDIEQTLTPLTDGQLWARPHGLTSAGFHAKHLAGSTLRLCAYLEGRQLTPEELAEAALESDRGESAVELIERVSAALTRFNTIAGRLRMDEYGDLREVGRKRVQTTAISLAIHIAEHGQRHAGQAISAAKLAVAAGF